MEGSAVYRSGDCSSSKMLKKKKIRKEKYLFYEKEKKQKALSILIGKHC